MLIREVRTSRNPTPEENKRLFRFLDALGVETSYGDPQFPLPNMKLESEQEFWNWRSCWGFTVEAYAGSQKIDGAWCTVLIFFVDTMQLTNGGFAVAVERSHAGSVKYYSWRACDHSFVSKNIGRCLTSYTCEHCGESYEIDSSD